MENFEKYQKFYENNMHKCIIGQFASTMITDFAKNEWFLAIFQ